MLPFAMLSCRPLYHCCARREGHCFEGVMCCRAGKGSLQAVCSFLICCAKEWQSTAATQQGHTAHLAQLPKRVHGCFLLLLQLLPELVLLVVRAYWLAGQQRALLRRL